GLLACGQSALKAPATVGRAEFYVPVVVGGDFGFGAPAQFGRLQLQRHVLGGLDRMAQVQLQRRGRVEVAIDRQHLDQLQLGIDPHDRAELALARGRIGAEVGGLHLRGTLHRVGDGVVVAGVAGDHDHRDATDDRRRDQRDHQPDDRLSPRRRVLGGVLRGCVVGIHHIGPKKLLSTVSRILPSADSITKTTSWRPFNVAGAVATSGNDSTCAAPARTVRAPPSRAMSAWVDCRLTRYSLTSSVLLTSLSVYPFSTPSTAMRYSALRSRSTSAISGLRVPTPQLHAATSTSSSAP